MNPNLPPESAAPNPEVPDLVRRRLLKLAAYITPFMMTFGLPEASWAKNPEVASACGITKWETWQCYAEGACRPDGQPADRTPQNDEAPVRRSQQAPRERMDRRPSPSRPGRMPRPQ